MLNWLAHLLRSPLLPWPLSTVHPPIFLSPPLISSLAPFFSPPPLFRTWATPVYSRAFSFIVQLQGCISMLISPWIEWILKGRVSRRRWAAERETERERTGKTDRWAFRARQHGWENSSRKCDGWAGDFAPFSPRAWLHMTPEWHSGPVYLFQSEEKGASKRERSGGWKEEGERNGMLQYSLFLTNCSVDYEGNMDLSRIYCTAWWDLVRWLLHYTAYAHLWYCIVITQLVQYIGNRVWLKRVKELNKEADVVSQRDPSLSTASIRNYFIPLQESTMSLNDYFVLPFPVGLRWWRCSAFMCMPPAASPIVHYALFRAQSTATTTRVFPFHCLTPN